MGDRCYMRVSVSPETAALFEVKMDFTDAYASTTLMNTYTDDQYSPDPDPQGDGLPAAAKAGCVFFGEYGPGMSYGSWYFLSDEQGYQELEVGFEGGYVIDIDAKTSEFSDKELNTVRDFHRRLRALEVRFGVSDA